MLEGISIDSCVQRIWRMLTKAIGGVFKVESSNGELTVSKIQTTSDIVRPRIARHEAQEVCSHLRLSVLDHVSHSICSNSVVLICKRNV